MQIKLTTAQQNEIHAHGEATFPNECCGAILGAATGEPRTVAELLPIENAHEEGGRHDRFLITPLQFMQTEREARSRGLEVIGFYHSHPGSSAQPSAFDQDHAWPWYSYIIVSVMSGKAAEMTSWRLKDDRSAFDEEKICVMV